MRQFKVNNTNDKSSPSKETIQKYKDFPALSHEYTKLTRRPKVPLYKDKKMFLILLLIVAVAFLVAQANQDKPDQKDQKDSNVKENVQID